MSFDSLIRKQKKRKCLRGEDLGTQDLVLGLLGTAEETQDLDLNRTHQSVEEEDRAEKDLIADHQCRQEGGMSEAERILNKVLVSECLALVFIQPSENLIRSSQNSDHCRRSRLC